MSDFPSMLDGAEVVGWSPIDGRHRRTGNNRHLIGVESEAIQPASALAIVQVPGDGALYLYHLDEGRNLLADTWHTSVAEARRQAEFEYAGVDATWIFIRPNYLDS